MSLASGRNFFTHLAGDTDGAHQDFVKRLQDVGHVETFSPQDSDYLLLFCPVVSCVGTDIKEALSSISGGNFILIVGNWRGKFTEEAWQFSCLHNRIWRFNMGPNKVKSLSQVVKFNLLEPAVFLKSVRLRLQKWVTCKLYTWHLSQTTWIQISKKTPTAAAIIIWCNKLKHLTCQEPEPKKTSSSSSLVVFSVVKPTVLVVMHHTFNPDSVVADSSRQVNDSNVYLTIDCLFHQGKLLRCNRNDIAWYKIQQCFGISSSQVNDQIY